MSDDPYAERRKLTFAQAEGSVPLPTQLKLKELSKELRAALWAVIYESIDDSAEYSGTRKIIVGRWNSILRRYFVLYEHKMLDEFSALLWHWRDKLKIVLESGDYVAVFDLVQFILRDPQCPKDLPRQVQSVLKRALAAYVLVGGNTICPVGSENERVTIERAFADLDPSEFGGARVHLRDAAGALTAGEFAASVRESIHAVEAVARTLAPNGMLNDALDQLEKQRSIHGALKRGFMSIYGYTNDEKGIRHPLLDDPQANVDEADALFMIGACAAFVSYLINKSRQR